MNALLPASTNALTAAVRLLNPPDVAEVGARTGNPAIRLASSTEAARWPVNVTTAPVVGAGDGVAVTRKICMPLRPRISAARLFSTTR